MHCTAFLSLSISMSSSLKRWSFTKLRAFLESASRMAQAINAVFANSAGQLLRGRATRATVDGIHQSPTSAGSGHAASVRLDDLDGAAVGHLAAQRARDGAEPFDTKPGHYEVVLAPECTGTIAVV